MQPKTQRVIGLAVFTLLYPLTSSVLGFIPNPMIPGANIAFNMIFPILAGHFYGPLSGGVAGSIGTASATLVSASAFEGMAIFPHTGMGIVAGWVGQYRSEPRTALTIIIGHGLNILFYLRLGLMSIPPDGLAISLLGLLTETMIDLVAIVLLIFMLKRSLYSVERW